MPITTVTISEIEFEVDYTIDWGYEPTREDPGIPAHICELTVRLADHEVTHVLSQSVLNDIEDACIADAERERREDFAEPDDDCIDPPF